MKGDGYMARSLMERRITLQEVPDIKHVSYGEMRWRAEQGELKYVGIKPNKEKKTFYIDEDKLREITGISRDNVLRLRAEKAKATCKGIHAVANDIYGVITPLYATPLYTTYND